MARPRTGHKRREHASCHKWIAVYLSPELCINGNQIEPKYTFRNVALNMIPGPQSFEPTADRGRELRNAFGCFGTGVTIITTQTPDGPLAMTANSFSSLSLDPALVMWSPAKSSLRHDPFVAAKCFCIHVLCANQLGMAKHFASNGSDFTPFDWNMGPVGAPTLSGCLAEFHCDTYAVHPAGDHSLILGQIRHVLHHGSQETGLLFDKGRFGQFAPLPDPSQ